MAFRIAPQPSYGIPSRTRKTRSRDPRRPSERAIQYALVDRLRLTAPPDVLWMAIPNGELRDLATLAGAKRDSAAKLRAMGVRNGAADMLFIKGGRVLFLELKRPGGRQSSEQVEFAGCAEDAGAEYVVCDGLDEAVAILTSKGILPPDRRAA